MNVIVLGKNIHSTSGYYHTDWLEALSNEFNVFFYGPNFPLYNKKDDITDVISKSSLGNKLDGIIVSSNWDNEITNNTVDPHPNIKLKNLKNIFKVYFINKEYKKLDLRFRYIKENNFDLVCSVLKNSKEWEKKIGRPVFHLPFGVNLARFKYHSNKKYDFGFTGSVHKNYINSRYNVKNWIFNKDHINKKSNLNFFGLENKQILSSKYNKLKIYWDEYGSRNLIGKSRLPVGKKYAKFLSLFKGFLNTKSAMGIVNTRFYELMSSKSLIVCPKDENNYDDLLYDGVNCVFFDNYNDFNNILLNKLQDEEYVSRITNNAFKKISNHTYESRIKKLRNYIVGNI